MGPSSWRPECMVCMPARARSRPICMSWCTDELAILISPKHFHASVSGDWLYCRPTCFATWRRHGKRGGSHCRRCWHRSDKPKLFEAAIDTEVLEVEVPTGGTTNQSVESTSPTTDKSPSGARSLLSSLFQRVLPSSFECRGFSPAPAPPATSPPVSRGGRVDRLKTVRPHGTSQVVSPCVYMSETPRNGALRQSVESAHPWSLALGQGRTGTASNLVSGFWLFRQSRTGGEELQWCWHCC